MSTRKDMTGGIDDPIALHRAMTNIAERGQKIMADFIERNALEETLSRPDPYNIGGAFLEMTTKLLSDPQRIIEANLSLWQNYLSLWQSTTRRILGEETEPVAAPLPTDRRFKDEMWEVNEVFDFIKQSYLLSSRWVQGLVQNVDDMDPRSAQKVEFYTRQFVDAMAPSNFVMTNPEVLRATVETGGENLLKGLNNLLTDLERGKGKLSISMTDYDAFKVGENIAVTPGKVVFRNEMIELIQYDPSTPEVFEKPLLIVPPWINKYYILDLRPKNSLVAWARDQGHTVFLISWVNPGPELAHKDFTDYMLQGPLAALAAVEKITGQPDANVIAYCIGGTLLSCTMAYLAAKGEQKIASATLLTTMTDFSDPGELGVFIDDVQVSTVENKMSGTGFLEGRDMASTFNLLRSNDLIWSFVINNYLLGKEPFPFDLLYWNSDSTRMPAAMHSSYLRLMYKENKLIVPGAIVLDGVPIDLGKINVPFYMLSTKEDHIAPWTSTYTLQQRVPGSIRFVLSASGHVAGVVNPPVADRYSYWTNSRWYKNPQKWLENATQHHGSWWVDWQAWVEKRTGTKIPARIPGKGKLKALCDAPGEYVKVRSE